MITCEVLHIRLKKIFVCTGFELHPNSSDYDVFQNSNEEEVLKDKNIFFAREYIEDIEILN